MVESLIERDGTQCTWCCREMIDRPIHPDQDCSLHMTLEHVIPLSKGGTNDLVNLALACFQCNNARASFLGIFEPVWALVD
jgi:5-methylcytosine-specific restriction endonuclease McrA